MPAKTVTSTAVRRVVPLPVVLPLVVGLAAALVLEQRPDGAITGRDRDLVARLARGGVQRFDADGHAGFDHGDGHDVSVAPAPHALAAITVPTAGPQHPGGVAIVPARTAMAPPPAATRRPGPFRAVEAVPAPHARSPRGRAPPRA
jgi:hypothetical protein